MCPRTGRAPRKPLRGTLPARHEVLLSPVIRTIIAAISEPCVPHADVSERAPSLCIHGRTGSATIAVYNILHAGCMPAAPILVTPRHCSVDPMCSEGASSGIVGNSQDIDEAMSTPTARIQQRPSSGVGLPPSAPSPPSSQPPPSNPAAADSLQQEFL